MLTTTKVYFFILITNVLAYEFSQIQITKLIRATDEFEAHLIAGGVVSKPSVIIPMSSQDEQDTKEAYFMLPYILFDPMEQFQSCKDGRIKLFCHLCHDEGKVTLLQRGPKGSWNNARKKRSNPRLIFDIEGPVLLVSKIYRCSNGHDVPASCCSTPLMEYLPSHMLFMLTHRSGMTIRLMQDIEDMLDNGLAIVAVEEIIQKRYKRSQNTMLIRFLTDRKELKGHRSLTFIESDYTVGEAFPFPGRSLITSFYYGMFLKNEQHYERVRNAIAPPLWISCDHTFKSATNIGFEREEDGAWITKYSSLFCILNEKGQVIRWKFALTDSFDDIKPLFESLARDVQEKGYTISAVYIDNCCKWRHQLSTVFPGVPVKLDLFHAVQRVTKKLSKRSATFSDMCRDYSLVFREQYDQGKERTSPTPNSNELMANLNRFIEKWKTVKTSSGSLIMNKEILKEIRNIQCHIRKGCLSNIPPGCGTSRNERLHRELKKTAVKNRIGVDLAKARLERIIYNENRKKNTSLPSLEETVIEDIKTNSYSANICSVPCIDSPNDCREVDIKMNLKEMNTSQISTMQATISNLMNKCNDLSDGSESESDETPFSAHKNSLSILRDALQLCKIAAFLKGKLGTKVFDYKDIPKCTVPQTTSREEGKLGDSDDMKTKIKNIATSWGFECQPVIGDGNCLFTSVATQLSNLALDVNDGLTAHLINMGFHENLSVNEIAIHLRNKVVEELQGEREEYYQQFLPINVDVVVEAEQLRELAITPDELQPSNHYITLAFNPTGPGHYDVLVTTSGSSTEANLNESSKTVQINEIATKAPMKETLKERKLCRCGEKDKHKKGSSRRKYKSRCNCIQKYGACMKTCKCAKRCGELNCGGNEGAGAEKQSRRKRTRPMNSKNTSTPKKPKTAAGIDEKEIGLNVLEFFVLHAILLHTKNENGFFCDIYYCNKIYSSIVNLVSSFAFLRCLPIFKHSLKMLSDEKKRIEGKIHRSNEMQSKRE
ncbi:uncharacterized protein LOC114574761 [Exaiptasia diaphana]|uniref:OTU domain-containing protein n=1 Tax=Exaiptasia diaphana TaxID=2652724 RepID=A0A913YG07_EXADI|nr:uncharacterized protein LOC114574761 [Exaiptasia diaphana]KXJ16275.1 hypothetical protein AC249_AIPGENE28268 [Exaiptasia diaphana]